MFTTFGGGSGFGGPSTGGRDAYSLFRTPAAATARTRNAAGGAAVPPPPPPNTASRRLSLTQAGGPEALPPPPLHETAGDAEGGAANGADIIIEELYAFASDPANYPSGGAGTAASSAAGGGAYEAYCASQSSAQKRERFQRRLQTAHGALLRRLAELSTRLDNNTVGGGGGGGGGGDDGRFLTWVAATVLHPDGAVIRRALAESETDSDEGEGEEEAETLLARRLGEALDGLAASVRDCLPVGIGYVGEEEAQPSRAMLRVLLGQNNGGGAINHGDAGSLPLRSYLALPGRVRAALGTDPGPGKGIHTTSSSGHNKRRRLHLHGGG